MAVSFDGATQLLSASSTLLSNEPITLIIQGNSISVTAWQVALSLGNNGADGQYSIAWRGELAGDPIGAGKASDGGVAGRAETVTGYTANNWFVGAGRFISDTSRAAWINGGGKGTNTTSVADPTPDFITVGAMRLSTIVRYFAGSLAEAYVINAALTDAQHAAIGLGVHPIAAGAPISNVRGWYPLLGDHNNRIAGGYPNLTPTNAPAFSAHPPQFRLRLFGGRYC